MLLFATAYTGVSLLSLYHDVINAKNLLRRGISTTDSGEPVPPPYSLSVAKWVSNDIYKHKLLQTAHMPVRIDVFF